MATTTRAVLDEILKVYYLGPIRDQLESATVLSKRLERRKEGIDGKNVYVPLRIGRNRGIQAVSEGGTLPLAGTQSYGHTETTVKYNYGAIRLTGPAMATSRTDQGAFMSALDQDIQGLVEDIKKDFNRQMFGDGSGRLATIDDITDIASGKVGVRGVWDSGDQATTLQHIMVGDRLGFVDVSSATASDVQDLTGTSQFIECIEVDYDAKTVTVGTPGTGGSPGTPIAITGTQVGDHLVKGVDTTTANFSAANSNFSGSAGTAANENKEVMGLVGLVNGANGFPANSQAAYRAAFDASTGASVWSDTVSSTTDRLRLLQNFGNAVWRANMDFNAGVPRALTIGMMQTMQDKIERVGTVTPTIILTTHDVRRKYVDIVTIDRRFQGPQAYALDGGFKAVDFNDIPLVVDVDAPEATMFFLTEPHIQLYSAAGWHWLDKDGSILKYIDRIDAYEAILANYSELATDRRNAHGAIGDILVT